MKNKIKDIKDDELELLDLYKLIKKELIGSGYFDDISKIKYLAEIITKKILK